jgi:hypothetical protein
MIGVGSRIPVENSSDTCGSVTCGPRFGRIPFLGSYKRNTFTFRLHATYISCAAGLYSWPHNACHTTVSHSCRVQWSCLQLANLNQPFKRSHKSTSTFTGLQDFTIPHTIVQKTVSDTNNGWKLTPKCLGMLNVAEVTAYLEAPKLTHNSHAQNPTRLTSNSKGSKHNSSHTQPSCCTDNHCNDCRYGPHNFALQTCGRCATAQAT